MLPKSTLENLYCKQKLSLAKIAKQVDVSTPTVANWMNKYNIPRRTISQSLTGRKLSKEHTKKVRKNIDKANAERSKNGVNPEERERLREIARARKGYKHSSETKKKMSKAHQGKKIGEATRKKMSETRKKFKGPKHPLYGAERLDMKGENNPNWNGGIAPLYRKIYRTAHYKEWRRAVFSRDGFKCTMCKSTKNLEADHIKQFAVIVYENNIQSTKEARDCKELWDIDNGRTLCQPCHSKTKTYAGRGRILLHQKKVNDYKELERGHI